MMDENRVFPAFATPILNITWPDAETVNTELSQVVVQRAPTSASDQTPAQAWRSTDDLLHWGGPAINELIGWIQYAVEQLGQAITAHPPAVDHRLQFFAWADVFAPGGYEPVHDTAAYTWSGVYFADPGDAPASSNIDDTDLSGVLQLQDPRLGVGGCAVPGDQIGQPILIRPQAGRMLVFPGWLPRMTHPYRGTRPRIAIGFNADYVPVDGAAEQRDNRRPD